MVALRGIHFQKYYFPGIRLSVTHMDCKSGRSMVSWRNMRFGSRLPPKYTSKTVSRCLDGAHHPDLHFCNHKNGIRNGGGRPSPLEIIGRLHLCSFKNCKSGRCAPSMHRLTVSWCILAVASSQIPYCTDFPSTAPT